MSFRFTISPSLAKQLDKLAHRDKALAVAVRKKIVQIKSSDPASLDHFKNLRGPLKYGLFDPELKEGARDLLLRLEGHLSEETYREFSERVETGRIPAVRQIEIFETSGREGLYKAMTTR